MPHPSWVRGLKWSFASQRLIALWTAAPFVGAWIEISQMNKQADINRPHPSWVRGLKYQNHAHQHEQMYAAPFVGAWIEITDPQSLDIWHLCRTLRGCVD